MNINLHLSLFPDPFLLLELLVSDLFVERTDLFIQRRVAKGSFVSPGSALMSAATYIRGTAPAVLAAIVAFVA